VNKIYLPTQVPVLGPFKRQKVLAIRAARGIPARVDLDEVQAHIHWLRGIGFLDDAIGAAAGVPQKTIYNIRLGVYSTVRIEQAARIKSVSHAPVDAQAPFLVPAIGTRRRIHALWALAHSSTTIGERLGVSKEMVIRHCHVPRVRGTTWARVRDVLEELSSVPGESVETRRVASRRGLPAPLDWEGLDIDHPDHHPVAAKDAKLVDEVLVARILKGDYKGSIPRLERDAVMDYALAHGWTNTRVADVLNTRPDSASRAIVNHRRKNRGVAS
jgi:hypothetical protein